MCQQLNVQLYTTIEPHVHSLYHYDHKISFMLLISLKQLWVGRIFPQLKSSNTLAKKILEHVKKYLTKNNLYIGPATFISGFLSVLLEACRSDYVNIVQYVLDQTI